MYETILITDDEKKLRGEVRYILEDEGYRVEEARDGLETLEILRRKPVDLILLDIRLPGINGIELIRKILQIDRDSPIIMISAYGDVDNVVASIKGGAEDFIAKPYENERLLITIRNALEKRQLRLDRDRLLKEKRNLIHIMQQEHNMIGSSRIMKDLYKKIQKVARVDSTILILGESGTGKELVARAIHAMSDRVTHPIVTLNCAAIPKSLMESQLFGHKRGAFTGAIRETRGVFQQANKGTLFLDEIGDMPASLQAKVLRTIETGEFTKVGGAHGQKTDTRIIAATNKNLKNEIQEGRFREDLYYRLSVVELYVPTLRERVEDIPSLVEFFVNKFCSQHNVELKSFSEGAMQSLISCPWKGNVRELRSLIEKLVVLVDSHIIDSELLRVYWQSSTDYYHHPLHKKSLKDAKQDLEKQIIIARLYTNKWNISRTAEELGEERSNFYKKLKKLDIYPNTMRTKK